jgi:hypothetical protein
MDDLPPNPYVDLPLRQLSEAISKRAGALLADKPTGRRDTAYLLIAAARKIDPMTPHPNSPVNQVKQGGSALEAFLPVYEDEARHHRYRIFVHADDTLRAHHKVGRLVSHGRWDALCALAIENEAGLRAAIQELDEAAQALRI